MTESELIAAARLGDQQAFAQLHRLYVGYVKRVARSMVRSDDVEDLCQDTFLLAFTRLQSFEGSSQFRTWLTRICINQCLASLRKARMGHGDGGEPELLPCNDAQLEGVAERMDLDKLLRRVRPSDRQVLEMAYLDGMPDQEIAAALNTTLASVTSRIHKAKRHIRGLTQNNQQSFGSK
jgi:RNA polymerase sigma-70 factor (ECF subfamily)